MEIEYKKREVTWCLDRDGPRICLQATLIENDLIKLIINCSDFSLELDKSEIKGFLDLLYEIMGIEEVKKGLEDLRTDDEIIRAFDDAFLRDQEISDINLTQEISTLSESMDEFEFPDPSELLQKLEETKPKPNIESTTEPIKKDLEENFITPELTFEEIKKLEDEYSRVESSDSSDLEIETASFFQKSVDKTPLEILLEEEDSSKLEDDTDKTQVLDNTLAIESDNSVSDKYLSKPEVYRPSDLKTDSFFSRFQSNDILKILESEETKDTSPPIKNESADEPLTDLERRAAIEKRRAERKKRLWELTRGF